MLNAAFVLITFLPREKVDAKERIRAANGDPVHELYWRVSPAAKP
jgi:hypothetical protein